MSSTDGFSFTEVRGDLFEAAPATDSLAHCVSEDLRMGKGIADQFRKRFQGIPELKAQRKSVGEVAYLSRDDRYVFCLITKPTAWDKPTREDFEGALRSLRHLCEKLGVRGLSMPRIGAGLDKLPLEFVHDCVRKVFEGSNVQITMYYL